MKRIHILVVLPLLGCATGGPAGGDLTDAPQIRTVIAGSTSSDAAGGAYPSTIRYTREPITVEEVVAGRRDEIWPVLIEAFRAEGLEPDGADPAAGILTLSRDEWAGSRDGIPLSTYLDCGPSSTGRQLADDARIVASIAAQVVSGETGNSMVTLRLDAVAYPFDASSGQTRGCTTLGTLEHDIINRVRTTLDTGRLGLATADPEVTTDAEVTADPTPTSPFSPTFGSDLPLKPGDQVRVWVAPSVQLTGSFLGFRPDTLLLLRSRRTALPLWSIEALQVKRTESSSTVIGALIGVATGVTLALTTDLGIGGSHAVQGDLLNPGLGALAGGLAGAAVGHMFIGTSWEDLPWEAVGPGVGRPAGREKLP